ncbi:uncharacterized protein LOC127832240 isoform X2 [Dreissena polymorpha]|uniref:uncharacterized protein LOC127832240 isoform X2 n=1 Tax=Dreissena polymorpha TaxID=45954 RepID=UPI0022656A15|nr:uncharacterized protein LOC127832240 isoform X2 [Dreissena polymorpha]
MKRRSKLSSQNKKIDIKSSGEDEFSGRSGQMEFDLNADVKANEKRLKHSFKLCLLGLVIIIAIYKFHMIGSLSKTNVDEIVINQTETGWKRTFKNRLFGGANVMFDVDEDGKPDILSGAGDLMTYNETLFCMESNDDDTAGQFSHFHDLCKDFNLTYPCKAVIFAVRGYDGKLLWELPVRSIPLFFNCEDVDVNQDNKTDCIVSGRSGTLMAFDPRKGKTLWMSEPQDFIKANWNVYRVVAIGDLDNDGVTELLVSNGGNPAKTAEETDRDPGRLLVVSGADGKPYGRRYLNMPNRRETYMSPILYKPFHHYYILFGSGGESISGDLMGIDLTDFLCYTFPNPECKARNGSTDPWNLKEKNEDNIFIIYRGEKKGVMVTPVIVDANNDGVQDIILSMFEGKIVLIDGKTANEVWTTLYNGMESYSTPAPGYFNNDDILDYMVNWNKGAWFTYSSANVSIINGKDGSILWTLSSAYMQFSSSLVASTNHKHKHAFVFRQQGRGSVFRWTPGGQILRPGETLNDLKLHLSIKDTDSDMQRPHDDYEVVFPDELDKDDLKRLNMTRVDYKRLKYKLTTLTCEDDVDSFRGEVLMIDIDSLNSAYRIIDRPMEKYHYNQPHRTISVKRRNKVHGQLPCHITYGLLQLPSL